MPRDLVLPTLAVTIALTQVAWGAGPNQTAGEFDLSVRGRIQLDALYGDADQRDIDTRVGVRRAGLGITARWGEALSADASAAIDEDGAALAGAYLAYEPSAGVRLRVGKFGGPFGMERRASSGETLLMERALPTALTSRAAWGAAASYANDSISAEVAWFSDWNENDVGTRGSDGRGVAARAAWHRGSAARDGFGLHLGVSGEVREPDGGLYRVRARPEAELVESRLLDTGLLRDVDGRRNLGLEVAAYLGSVLFQAEAMRSDLERDRGDVEATGGYVQLGWVVTGSPRRYRDVAAAVGEPRNLDDRSAVELVARYSTLDLEDSGLSGGDGNVWAVGVNWFASRHVRLSLVASRAEGKPDRSGREERIDHIQARVQLEL